MKKKRRTAIVKFLTLILMLFAALLNTVPVASAESLLPHQKQGMYIDNISVAELQKLYKDNGYVHFIPRDSWEVPAIFLKKLPNDFDTINDDNLRNQLFIQILSPLALKVNEEILAERAKLEKLSKHFEATHQLDNKQQAWLDSTAEKYNVFTRFKGYRRNKLIISKLMNRIDILPPSVMIAASGIETDWGKSRLVKDGNSLYKEVVWYSKDGLIPEDETTDDTYRIKIFPSLYDSMKSFALKINSGINYEDARSLRYEQRRRGKIIDGRSMASSFLLLSAQKNFIGLLDYTITFYELVNVDASKLIYKLPLIPPQPGAFVTKT